MPWYSLLGNRSLVLLTLSYSAVGYFQYLFFYWLEYYFKSILKLDTDTSRLYATIPMLSMAAGMFLGGWVADDLSRRVGVAAVEHKWPRAGCWRGPCFWVWEFSLTTRGGSSAGSRWRWEPWG